MGFRNFVSSAFATRDLNGLSDEQLGSIVTTLVLCAHADANVTKDEQSELEQALRELPWSNANARGNVRAAIESATALAGSLADKDARVQALQPLAASLPSDAVRERVYRMAILVNSADGELNAAEREFLFALASAFGIEDAKARSIFNTLKVQAGVFE